MSLLRQWFHLAFVFNHSVRTLKTCWLRRLLFVSLPPTSPKGPKPNSLHRFWGKLKIFAIILDSSHLPSKVLGDVLRRCEGGLRTSGYLFW